MKRIKARWLMLLLVPLAGVPAVLHFSKKKTGATSSHTASYNANNNEWIVPDEKTIPLTEEGERIRYGRKLIAQTALYLGPKGVVMPLTNGMNCQNCHLDAGTRPYGNSFAAVASTYPRYRERSGMVESIEFRINDCLVRSLNGNNIDSLSPEMRAMVAYLKWLGRDVPKHVKPKGAGVAPLPFLSRAADPFMGRKVYVAKCRTCHGTHGQGAKGPDSSFFVYPPLWGTESYNTGAGLFRLSQFAAYVKCNMPLGATYKNPQLTNEEAWDVAAFINSQPRPYKNFNKDWPDLAKKPVDYPFGPYVDGFSEARHKYGPFEPIRKKKAGE